MNSRKGSLVPPRAPQTPAPRPAAVQPKVLAASQKSRPAHTPPAVLPPRHAAAQAKQPPAAPPVYRPQPVPKVLQTKPAVVKTAPAPPPAGAQLKPSHLTPPRTPAAAASAPSSPPPIQLKPAGAGGVIQPAKRIKHAPAKAKGPVTYYTKSGTKFATDGSTHWYQNRAGTWTRTRTGKTPTYNRFTGQTMGRGGQRQASFKSRMGSGASYSDTKRQRRILRSTPPVEVKGMKRGKRTYRSKMRAATSTEGHITTTSATAYAAHFGAPVIPGGYNWCHLHGHGGGGSDDPSNIVAASTHCNSEQLEIEKIVYQYRNSGVRLKVVAEQYNGQSQYLARKITCTVYVGSKPVYVREIDALRQDKPSFVELLAVKHNLTKAITSELNN